MHSRPYIARIDRAPVARAVTAMVLVFALLSLVVPLGSLASAHASCSMPCCIGKAAHAGGSCTDHSCHLDAAPIKKEEPKADPICGAGDANSADAKTRTHGKHAAHPTKRGDKSDNSASAKHPAAHDASRHHSSRSLAPDAAPHSTQASSRRDSRHEQHASQHHHSAAVLVALTKPCPPDCSTSAASFTNRTPSQKQAATAYQSKPRPPNGDAQAYTASHPLAFADGSVRQAPSRAPPFALIR